MPFFKHPYQNCSHIQNDLFSYLDGELSPSARHTIEAHLENCTLCRAELEACRVSERVLQSAHKFLPAPNDLTTGFYAKLNQQRRRNRFVPLMRYATPAVASLFLLTLSLTLYKGNNTEPTTTGIARNNTSMLATAPTNMSKRESTELLNNLPDSEKLSSKVALPDSTRRKVRYEPSLQLKQPNRVVTHAPRIRRYGRNLVIAKLQPTAPRFSYSTKRSHNSPAPTVRSTAAMEVENDNSVLNMASAPEELNSSTKRVHRAYYTEIRVHDEERDFISGMERTELDTLKDYHSLEQATKKPLPPSELPALP